jgi:hypothetical protein
VYYVVSYAKAHRSLLLFGQVTNYHGCVIYFDQDSSKLNAILFSIQNYSSVCNFLS